MKCHFIFDVCFLLILVQPISAQDNNPYGQENPAIVFDDGLGYFGLFKDVEFMKKNFEKGNKEYRNIVSNHQQQNARRNNSQVNEYRSGGIQVDNDPPAWAKSRTRTTSQQAKVQQRKLRNAQIEQRNRKVREHNQRVMRERAAREAEKEAARKAEQERQRQIRYNKEYDRAMANSAQRFARQVDNAYQQRENMVYLRDKKIDNLPEFSSGHETTNEKIFTKPRAKTSIAGLVSKNRRRVAISGLDAHAVPITAIKDEAYYPKWEMLEIPVSQHASITKNDSNVWGKFKNEFSENRFAMVKHEIIKLNGGEKPEFVCYNDAGNAVFEGNNNIYSVTPNGDRIFFMSMDDHNNNIYNNFKDGKGVMDLEANAKGLGYTAEIKSKIENGKGIAESLSNNMETKLSNLDTKIEKTYQHDTIKNKFTNNILPSFDAKAKVKLLDYAAEGKVNYIRITENSVYEINASLKGGLTLEAEADVNFNSAKIKEVEDATNNLLTKAGVEIDTSANPKKKGPFGASADFNLETVSAAAGAAYKRVKNIKGQKYLVSYSLGGGVGHKLSSKSLMTNTYGFYDKAFFRINVESLDDDDIIIPIN